MVKRMEVSSEQVYNAIENGEFGRDMLTYENVVIIMTQDWCPQWTALKSWIYSLETEAEIAVYELIYNKAEYYRDFMRFKENVFGNYEVPYLRVYKNGTFSGDTNYLPRKTFLEKLEKLMQVSPDTIRLAE